MTAQAGIADRNHRRAVRFFWCLLVGASLISLIGNIAHAVLPYVPHVVVQIGAATVPPIALLAAVHGIALAVRAGASGRIYRWAVGAAAVIGAGAFAVSFLALRDLMQEIGYTPEIAWMFPAIIDTAVAVSTLMLVALRDKPAQRSRTVAMPVNTQTNAPHGLGQMQRHSARAEFTSHARADARPGEVQTGPVRTPASARTSPGRPAQDSAFSATQADAEFASKLIASGLTTQPVETVVAVLAASRDGASINAAAKASEINYRTAQRIVQAAAECRQQLPKVVA